LSALISRPSIRLTPRKRWGYRRVVRRRPRGRTHYNYFRDYDPQTGRYIESDPIGLYGGSFSTYAYVAGNPITNTDPLGLAPPGQGSQGGYQIPCTWPGGCIYQPGTPENAQAAQQLGDALDNAVDAIKAAAAKAARAIENACSSKTKEQNCRALYDTIVRSCWSITDPKKRQRCFEAAKSSYEECISQD
jgi:RHS repeat-associated protein